MSASALLLLLYMDLTSANARAAESFTVSSYTAVALETSPDVRSARDAYKSAEAAYKGQMAAMLLPTLGFAAASYPYGHNPLNSYQFEHWQLAQRQAQVNTTANWNLFNSFLDLDKTRSAALTKASAERALSAAKQDRAFAAIRTFYELNSKTELLGVAQQNLKAQKEQYDQTLDLYKHGMKSLADLLKSETDWRSSQLRIISAEAERKKALVDFNMLIDRNGDAETALRTDLLRESLLRESLKDSPEEAGATQLPTLTEDLARAVVQRPEIERARKDLEKARVAVSQAILGILPSFKVDATWNKAHSFAGSSASSIPNPNYYVGLALSLPIGFNGFSQAYGVAQAKAEKRRAEAAETAALRMVKSEVYEVFINLEKASKSYSVALLKEEIAAKALELVSRQYKQGAADAIRMNQAQNDHLNAGVERALALHDIFIDRARYKRAVGDQLW